MIFMMQLVTEFMVDLNENDNDVKVKIDNIWARQAENLWTMREWSSRESIKSYGITAIIKGRGIKSRIVEEKAAILWISYN